MELLELSVIVPVYNAECCLRACVDSLLAQDLDKELYEIILVDDGSTDKSPALCDEYANDSSYDSSSCVNIRVLHQPNKGVAEARNSGVNVAVGKYIAFLDADDWWTADHARKMLAFAEQYPKAGLWACNYIYYKPGKTRLGVRAETGYINYPKTYAANGGQVIWTGAAMMKRTLLVEMGGFPGKIRLGEDFMLWSRVALVHPIAFLDEPLAYYNNSRSTVLRLTGYLHDPQYNMLFNLQYLSEVEQHDSDWKELCDKLRVGGLKSYWMSKQYHTLAQAELSKVDWSKQPKKEIRWYSMPIGLVRVWSLVLRMGSAIKQRIYNVLKVG